MPGGYRLRANDTIVKTGKNMRCVFSGFLLGYFCFIGCSQQPSDCRRFKEGTFTLTDKNNVYTIVRSGNWQLETKQGSGDTSTFAVDWIDDCTYKLTPYPSYFKKHPNESKDEMMKVTITKTTANSYFETTTSNFFPGEVRAEIVKVK